MVKSKTLIYRIPEFGICPNCKRVGTLHLSHLHTIFEHVISLLTLYKMYRCKECLWRGFRLTIIITKKSLKNILLYSVLIFVTVLIARFIILNYVLWVMALCFSYYFALKSRNGLTPIEVTISELCRRDGGLNHKNYIIQKTYHEQWLISKAKKWKLIIEFYTSRT